MEIIVVESFRVDVPLSTEEHQQKHYNSSDITRIHTDQGKARKSVIGGRPEERVLIREC